ncbi:MAG: hypothetical protein ACFFCW_24025 [Candidatus Hodarchaeota archaeon]
MADPVNAIVKEIPFAELVRKAALAVADGQTALDFNSVQTAQTLATTMLPAQSVILAIVETIDENGTIVDVNPLTNDHEMSLLAYGIEPTFYEFSETLIDLRFWVRFFIRSTRVESDSKFTKDLSSSWETSRKRYGGGGGLSLNLGFFKIGGGGGYTKTEAKGKYEIDLAVTSHHAFESQAYGLDATAACRLTTTLKPKPAAARAVPEIITQPKPPP